MSFYQAGGLWPFGKGRNATTVSPPPPPPPLRCCLWHFVLLWDNNAGCVLTCPDAVLLFFFLSSSSSSCLPSPSVLTPGYTPVRLLAPSRQPLRRAPFRANHHFAASRVAFTGARVWTASISSTPTWVNTNERRALCSCHFNYTHRNVHHKRLTRR